MTYLTGDTHGQFVRIGSFCRTMETKKTDTMIILGDAGFNYYLNDRDAHAKEYASTFPIMLVCIHGNHEARPQSLAGFEEGRYHGGKVLFEKTYPNIIPGGRIGKYKYLDMDDCIKEAMEDYKNIVFNDKYIETLN